ncbi:hypothetical protein COO60DRAFT_1597679, partial [Scenedesmus sp. NREL 46B-D3]
MKTGTSEVASWAAVAVSSSERWSARACCMYAMWLLALRYTASRYSPDHLSTALPPNDAVLKHTQSARQRSTRWWVL